MTKPNLSRQKGNSSDKHEGQPSFASLSLFPLSLALFFFPSHLPHRNPTSTPTHPITKPPTELATLLFLSLLFKTLSIVSTASIRLASLQIDPQEGTRSRLSAKREARDNSLGDGFRQNQRKKGSRKREEEGRKLEFEFDDDGQAVDYTWSRLNRRIGAADYFAD
ncbi:hypothetical protein BDY24DRAFT_237917 [Mrakia frigida]|uniref:uncharacterized protein n=1 Tax=Mrakia frigida TaxID=29902 RepID=UPI003FCBFD65